MTRHVIPVILLFSIAVSARANLSASLLTVSPGNEIYELEGHTEIRFFDPDKDIDMTVSWGVFDFDSPGFVYRFVKGETDYLAAPKSYQDFLYINRVTGRRVTEQQLDLDSAEVSRLFDLVRNNLLPENRIYRYNYVKDNCATRPMVLIEKALGDTLNYTGDTPVTSWRSEMARYHKNYPWYQFGIDIALGSGIDKVLSRREICYAPVALSDFFGKATRPDGRPIVKNKATLIIDGEVHGMPEPPTPWYFTPMAVSILILILTIFVSYHDIRRKKISKWLFSSLYMVAGIAGLLLSFLIFFSSHEATSPNWQYLWLNPLCFIGVIGVWLKKHNHMVYYYQIVNFVALITLSVIGLTGIQHLNIAVYPLIASFLITATEYIYINQCQTKSTSPSKIA